MHYRSKTFIPTRRSSDLGAPSACRGARSARSARRRRTRARTRRRELRTRREPTPGATLRGVHARRSEEHTSELQSRQYLVCRLLLEKKKNTKVDIITNKT